MTKKSEFLVINNMIQEGGIGEKLKALANSTAAAVSSVVPAAKEAWKNANKEDTSQHEVHNKSDTVNQSLNTIVEKLISIPTGKSRFVVFMSIADLKEHYLVSGGSGANFVNTFKDDKNKQTFKNEILSFFQNPLDVQSNLSPIVMLDQHFKFSDLISRANGQVNQVSVIIDVPHTIVSMLKSSKDFGSMEKSLTKLFSHQYYTMTLDIQKCSKISVRMDSLKQDTVKISKVFNPEFLKNYPDKYVLANAIEEFYDQKQQEVNKRKNVPSFSTLKDVANKDADAQTTTQPDQPAVSDEISDDDLYTNLDTLLKKWKKTKKKDPSITGNPKIPGDIISLLARNGINVKK